MPGLIFVHGGSDLQKSSYRTSGRGYWSSALPLVLEKHGFLQLEERSPDALLDPGIWREKHVVLVARLDAEHWPTVAVEGLAGATCPVVLEGPLPAAVGEVVGIRGSSTAPTSATVGGIGGAAADLARAYGSVSGGRITPARSRPVTRNPDVDWTSIPAVPITNQLAQAWREPGWEIERWELEPDVEILSYLQFEGADPAPAMIRRGNVCAFAWSVFAHLAQSHTAEPWQGSEFRSSARVTGIESTLLGIIDELHMRAGVARARVMPWPRGVEWVLNVRHDVDRFMTREDARRLLDLHDRAGTVATWYWRARHLHRSGPTLGPLGWNQEGRRGALEIARAGRHEIALHTEMLWAGGEREQRSIERATRERIVGTCSHGDPSCFRFQGAPNVLWAEKQGMLYTELLQHAHFHPHRFPVLSEDGTIAPLDVICLPHHESFDTGTEPDQFAAERITEVQPLYAAAGGMMQVMNHPDIHVDELFETLWQLPAAARTHWTARRAAAWWRGSHTRAQAELALRADGSLTFTSKNPIEDVVVEILEPDGARRQAVVGPAPAET